MAKYVKKSLDYIKQLNESGYQRPGVYNNFEFKQAIEYTAMYYNTLCPGDNEFGAILSKVKQYCEINPEAEGSYAKETKALKSLVPDLIDYSFKAIKRRENLEEKIAAKFDNLSVDLADSGAKEEERKIVAQFEGLAVREFASSALMFGFDVLINGALKMVDPNNAKGEALKKEGALAFSHEVIPSDLTEKFLANNPLMAGLVDIARLYPFTIRQAIGITGTTKAIVKLYKKDGDVLRALYEEIPFTEITNEEFVGNDGKAVWPIILVKAMTKAGLLQGFTKPGEIVECILGDRINYENVDNVLDLAESSNSVVELYDNLDDWADEGTSVNVYMTENVNNSHTGWYMLTGCYTDDDGVKMVRLYDPTSPIKKLPATEQSEQAATRVKADVQDYALTDFIACTEHMEIIEVKDHEAMFPLQHNGLDYIDEVDQELLDDNTINKRTVASYAKCAFDIFVSMCKTVTFLEEQQPEWQTLLAAGIEFGRCVAYSYKSDELAIRKPLEFLLTCVEDYKKAISPETTDSRELQRLRICDVIEYLYEIFNRLNDDRRMPYEVIIKDFAKDFAKLWLRSKHIDDGMEEIEHKANLLVEDEVFKGIIAKLPIHSLHNPTDELLKKALALYQDRL